ncbi:MAG: hypothetical protein AAGH67_13880, partial [Cyanobacteria bacterium P01_H01_bin.162]
VPLLKMKTGEDHPHSEAPNLGLFSVCTISKTGEMTGKITSSPSQSMREVSTIISGLRFFRLLIDDAF